MSKGAFIVIDGSDGSGKSTQYAKLCERIRAEGIEMEMIKFPQYKQPSAYFIEQYLQWQYGQADDVPPKRTSVFFALDRFAVAQHIRERLEQGVAIVADRYVVANMGLQGAKMDSLEARQEFFTWLDDFEYSIMGIPRPDINIVLSVSVGQTTRNMAKRSAESDHPSDVHEANPDFIRRSVEVYQEICNLFPDQYHRIDCMQDEMTMLPVDAIHKKIWELVSAQFQKGKNS
jgi:dTMP kinase